MCPAPPVESVENDGSGKPKKLPGDSLAGLIALLNRLCLALEAHTEAISALARSNEALVESLMQGEPEEEEGPDLRHL